MGWKICWAQNQYRIPQNVRLSRLSYEHMHSEYDERSIQNRCLDHTSVGIKTGPGSREPLYRRGWKRTRNGNYIPKRSWENKIVGVISRNGHSHYTHIIWLGHLLSDKRPIQAYDFHNDLNKQHTPSIFILLVGLDTLDDVNLYVWRQYFGVVQYAFIYTYIVLQPICFVNTHSHPPSKDNQHGYHT